MVGTYFILLFVLAPTVWSLPSDDRKSIRDLLEDDIIGAPDGKSGLVDKFYRWENSTIPFIFDDKYPIIFQNRFMRATEYITKRTCIRFVRRTNEQDYIRIISGVGCYSSVGRRRNEQIVSLPKACTLRLGVIVHELIHSIGFYHEMSRPDRDQYVTIHYENIEAGKEHNFVKYSDDYVSTFDVDYDFESIMHYGSDYFSKNGNSTISTIPPGIAIGQVEGMSPKDILKINRMYECDM